jgi:L-alanine-DL-glutamate epimerase-like enolase superfamily enzyme
MTRITLALAPLGADFVEPPGNARRVWPSREGWRVHAEADGGRGVGEASPLPGASIERPRDVEEALVALGPLTLPLDAPWAELAPRLAALRIPPSARFGLETAIFDLAAQRAGLPLATWLREGAAERCGVQVLLDRLDVPEGLLDGARAVKVKVGRARAAEAEAALLRALRAGSPSLVIRADANGAPLPPPLLDALREVGCALLEDPGSPAPGLPTALDASFVDDPDDALERVARGEAVAAVLKPTLLGGIGRTLALAEALRARAPGVELVVSHAYESSIALAASAHLALALGGGLHGLAPWRELERFEVEGRPIEPPAWIGRAEIVRPRRPGLAA